MSDSLYHEMAMSSALSIKFSEFVEEVKGWIKYDVLNHSYRADIPHTIRFEYDEDKKHKTVLISSPDHMGLHTVVESSANEEDIIEVVNDAILTYFEVPRYKALQIKNKFLPVGMEGRYRKFVFA